MGDEKFTEEELLKAAATLIDECVLGFFMSAFEAIRQRSPKFAEELRKDYEEWMAAYVKTCEENNGECSIEDLEKRLPGNKWCAVAEKVRQASFLLPSLSDEEQEAAAEEFRRDVEKRLHRLDIH